MVWLAVRPTAVGTDTLVDRDGTPAHLEHQRASAGHARMAGHDVPAMARIFGSTTDVENNSSASWRAASLARA
jgi:hypothetical protein